MNPLIQLKKAILLFPVALTCLALSPAVQAVSPPPDGGYPNQNTAEGDGALFSLTTGATNTGIGFNALSSNSDGDSNTAIGAYALQNNNGSENTATGEACLANNTTGDFNTATGELALVSNTIGLFNTAFGWRALLNNTTAWSNTAIGEESLGHNTTGQNNTATGAGALYGNTSGNHNIGIGAGVGQRLTTGSNNIDIGNRGVVDDANTIRIGKQGTQNSTFIAGISETAVTGAQVVVNSSGKLGVAVSSARFKEAIKPMDKASEAILGLKPVSFRYKEGIDPDRAPQFGLIADEVEKVAPELVVRDKKGKPFTVRYDAVNAMLLNEFLKEHRKVQELEANDVEQQNAIKALTAMVKEQASQLQKVSAQLELSKSAPQTVLNNR